MNNPPPDTRAYARGNIIKEWKKIPKYNCGSLSWSIIYFNDLSIRLSTPFHTYKDEIVKIEQRISEIQNKMKEADKK